MFLVDSHCHLGDLSFGGKELALKDVLASAAQAGVTHGPLSYPTEHELDVLLDTYDPSHDSPIYVKGNPERWYDTAPDLYHFDFCGYRGDFMILKDGTVRVYNSNVRAVKLRRPIRFPV